MHIPPRLRIESDDDYLGDWSAQETANWRQRLSPLPGLAPAWTTGAGAAFPIIRQAKGSGSLRVACIRAGTQVGLFGSGPSVSLGPTVSPSPVASGLGAGKPLRSKAAAFWSMRGLKSRRDARFPHLGRWLPWGDKESFPWLPPSLPSSLPLQMSTSAWRAPTTATSTPSARTLPSPTSASASPATPVTGSTAKVGPRHHRRGRSPSDE